MMSAAMYGSPVCGSGPVMLKVGNETEQPAAARSGRAGRSACSITSATFCSVRWRTLTGAGKIGLSREPSGTNAYRPVGAFVLRHVGGDHAADRIPDRRDVEEIGQLRLPRDCGAVPPKSAWTPSRSMVTATSMRSGSLP